MSTITIGIITHDAYLYNLEGLISRLHQQICEKLNIEVIALIQDSTLDKSSYNAKMYDNKGVCFLYTSKIYSPSEARNIIMGNSKGDWIAYIDGDCMIKDGYVDSVIQVINTVYDMEDIVIIQGAIYANGVSFFGKYEAVSDIRSLFELRYKDLSDYKYTKKFEKWLRVLYQTKDMTPIHKVQGFNCIVRRTAGEFDESFETAEDRELAMRVINQGKKIYFAQSIEVYHPYLMTLSRIVKRKEWHSRGCGRLNKKYGVKKKYSVFELFCDILYSKSIMFALYIVCTEFTFWKNCRRAIK